MSSVEIGRKWYEHLADLGFDVYIYDQAGSGLSGRLNNPADYTVKRHINDLEEIRKIIGDKKIILIGDSWGAILASNYMAEYPDNVVRAVFTSPGPLDFDNWNIKSVTPRLAPEFLQWINEKSGEKNYRHYLKLDSLLQTNLLAAYQYAGDKEMDKLADGFLNDIILKTTVFDEAKLKESNLKFNGTGWWVMTMTIWDVTNNNEAVTSKLSNNNTPVLILRGNSDYLPKEIADTYSTVFAVSKFIRVPDCGHLIWLEQPEIFTREIESFLRK